VSADTEALLATVREALMERQGIDQPWYQGEPEAALDSLAAELHAWKCLDEERVAELERVKAERDEMQTAGNEALARLDKALAALREIVSLEYSQTNEATLIGRRSLSEIEGEA